MKQFVHRYRYIIMGFMVPLIVMGLLGAAVTLWPAKTPSPILKSEEPKPVAVLGTYRFTSMHDETIPDNVEVVEILQEDNWQEYPYFYGYVDHDKMVEGDWWYSGAILRSDQKTKKMRYDPDTKQLWYYMLTGDNVYTLYAANPAPEETKA